MQENGWNWRPHETTTKSQTNITGFLSQVGSRLKLYMHVRPIWEKRRSRRGGEGEEEKTTGGKGHILPVVSPTRT